MNITIEPVKIEEKKILKQLLELYQYEHTQFDDRDIKDSGVYDYDYLNDYPGDYIDNYWTDKNKYPFFIKADNKLAGFILISDHPEIKRKTDYTLAEFFVLHKYRRHGIGRYVLNYIFNNYKGTWQLSVHPKNEMAVHFWERTINEYTTGKYEVITCNKDWVYEDGSPAYTLIFET